SLQDTFEVREVFVAIAEPEPDLFFEIRCRSQQRLLIGRLHKAEADPTSRQVFKRSALPKRPFDLRNHGVGDSLLGTWRTFHNHFRHVLRVLLGTGPRQDGLRKRGTTLVSTLLKSGKERTHCDIVPLWVPFGGHDPVGKRPSGRHVTVPTLVSGFDPGLVPGRRIVNHRRRRKPFWRNCTSKHSSRLELVPNRLQRGHIECLEGEPEEIPSPAAFIWYRETSPPVWPVSFGDLTAGGHLA
ncbi:MAG: hypothetical protein QG585_270, partial [Patescibacteria group bacterium]|nr:hypothetical protein [Patescibacteria group bacterium]